MFWRSQILCINIVLSYITSSVNSTSYMTKMKWKIQRNNKGKSQKHAPYNITYIINIHVIRSLTSNHDLFTLSHFLHFPHTDSKLSPTITHQPSTLLLNFTHEFHHSTPTLTCITTSVLTHLDTHKISNKHFLNSNHQPILKLFNISFSSSSYEHEKARA